MTHGGEGLVHMVRARHETGGEFRQRCLNALACTRNIIKSMVDDFCKLSVITVVLIDYRQFVTVIQRF